MVIELQEIYEFTDLLGHSLSLVKRANELPEFVLAKARDLNASQTLEALSNIEDRKAILEEIASRKSDAKIANNLEYETKKDLYEAIEKIQYALSNLTSAHYGLMLERYINTVKLAGVVQDLLLELLEAEQTKGDHLKLAKRTSESLKDKSLSAASELDEGLEEMRAD